MITAVSSSPVMRRAGQGVPPVDEIGFGGLEGGSARFGAERQGRDALPGLAEREARNAEGVAVLRNGIENLLPVGIVRAVRLLAGFQVFGDGGVPFMAVA